MACNNSGCNNNCGAPQQNCGNGYGSIIIIVLYILLAIILGSYIIF